MTKFNKKSPANAWFEFESFQYVDHLPGIKIPFCGLCGNSGIINTIGIVKTAQGKPCGVRAYCICPNGRIMKKTDTCQSKWGGDSVIETDGLEK